MPKVMIVRITGPKMLRIFAVSGPPEMFTSSATERSLSMRLKSRSATYHGSAVARFSGRGIAVELKHGQESLLRHLDAADLLHLLLALFLVLEQLALT